jgi:hypothetical protein
MARRLRTIARHVNESVKGLTARVEPSYSSTDRQLTGTRLRSPGKGRSGNKLTIHVTGHPEWVVLAHDSSETYRSNDEVELWLADWESPRKTIYMGIGKLVPKADILSGKWFED